MFCRGYIMKRNVQKKIKWNTKQNWFWYGNVVAVTSIGTVSILLMTLKPTYHWIPGKLMIIYIIMIYYMIWKLGDKR